MRKRLADLFACKIIAESDVAALEGVTKTPATFAVEAITPMMTKHGDKAVKVFETSDGWLIAGREHAFLMADDGGVVHKEIGEGTEAKGMEALKGHLGKLKIALEGKDYDAAKKAHGALCTAIEGAKKAPKNESQTTPRDFNSLFQAAMRVAAPKAPPAKIAEAVEAALDTAAEKLALGGKAIAIQESLDEMAIGSPCYGSENSFKVSDTSVEVYGASVRFQTGSLVKEAPNWSIADFVVEKAIREVMESEAGESFVAAVKKALKESDKIEPLEIVLVESTDAGLNESATTSASAAGATTKEFSRFVIGENKVELRMGKKGDGAVLATVECDTSDKAEIRQACEALMDQATDAGFTITEAKKGGKDAKDAKDDEEEENPEDDEEGEDDEGMDEAEKAAKKAARKAAKDKQDADSEEEEGEDSEDEEEAEDDEDLEESMNALQAAVMGIVLEHRQVAASRACAAFESAVTANDRPRALAAAKLVAEAASVEIAPEILEGMAAKAHRKGPRPTGRTLVRKAGGNRSNGKGLRQAALPSAGSVARRPVAEGGTAMHSMNRLKPGKLAKTPTDPPEPKGGIPNNVDFSDEDEAETWVESVRGMNPEEFVAHMLECSTSDSTATFGTRVKLITEAWKTGRGKKDMARKITAANPIIKKKLGKGVSMEEVAIQAANENMVVEFTRDRLDEFAEAALALNISEGAEVSIRSDSVLVTIPKAATAKLLTLMSDVKVHDPA